MAKKRERAAWYLRMKRTTKLKTEIAAVLRDWPTGGECTKDSERAVVNAISSWARDLKELPESKP